MHIFGIVLDANLSMIMEYFPLGPLDQYLQVSNLAVIDLVEAATNLANALFHLVLIIHYIYVTFFKLIYY